ncbi:hypothetical protein KAZ66_03095 [Candidatus Woesebacteria bacterium]|nr:hypothetical protein [Candidatus Woesebacteria bacterium]
MNIFWKSVFYILLVFFILHTIRDILQIYDVDTPLATFMQTNHLWCRPYCDYAVFPHEVLGFIGTVIVLKRDHVGYIGACVLLSLPLWTIGFTMQLLGY